MENIHNLKPQEPPKQLESCNICNRSCKNLAKHMELCHKCNICEKIIFTSLNLKDHMEKMHMETTQNFISQTPNPEPISILPDKPSEIQHDPTSNIELPPNYYGNLYYYDENEPLTPKEEEVLQILLPNQ